MTTPVSIRSLVNAITVSFGVLALLAAMPAECVDPQANVPTVTQTTGSISGTVTDSVTGSGIQPCVVFARRADSFNQYRYSFTSATGTYQIADLAPGSYYMHVQSQSAQPGYLDEFYDNLILWTLAGPWSTWPLTAVVVEEGATTDGIDFELDRGGFISGVVAPAGTGPAADLSTVRVELVHLDSEQWRQFPVDQHDGSYRLYGLESGDYAVFTKGAARLVNEVFDDHRCEAFVDCDPAASGDPVHAVRTLDTAGIDFTLDRGGWISGRVRHGWTGEPLTATVDVFHLDGTLAAPARQLGGGDWETWADYGLAAGSYLVRASTGVGGVWLHGDVHCPECDPSCSLDCSFPPSTPVVVTLGEETSGIEITVIPSGGIFGDGFESGGLERWSTSTP